MKIKIHSNDRFKISAIFLLFGTFAIGYSCNKSEVNQSQLSAYENFHRSVDNAFIGDKSCQSCHAGEWESWKGSHHDLAIAEADDESVRGDFENTKFSDGDENYRFYRDGESFMVDIVRNGGERETFQIDYTFGWEPLQQYLVNIGQGKLQALHAAWDTEKGEWFSLHPDASFAEDDWMHWMGGSMTWNNMCADCHSTNLKQNYIAEADSFHTDWSVINVSCEACHGPGGNHVDFVNSPQAEGASRERIRQDLISTRFTSQIDEINTCAPCHSVRQRLTDDYIHGDYFFDHFDPNLIHPDQYYADGQILGEVFEYGSFLQSRMYVEGVQCTDCHKPHSLELRQPLTENRLCLSCHEPQYNTRAHHFHEVNTEASQCINCHMIGRTYMGNDYRRDHSFRVPRPDQSVQYNVPNACNDCHNDRSAEWAAAAVEEWYGAERPNHFSNILLKANAGEPGVQPDLSDLIRDKNQPEIVRATAVWYIGRFPVENAAGILAEALESESAMIRTSAAKAMENLPPDMRRPLLETALSDSVRSVRISAMTNLTEFAVHDFSAAYRENFQNALMEYRKYLDVNEYFPQGQMNRGRFYEQQGDREKAIQAYRSALQRDPYFTPARINLAYLHNSFGENETAKELLITVTEQEPEFGDAYYSLGLLKAEENRMEDAIQWFEQASQLMPEHGRLFYNLAIAYQTVEKPQDSETAYIRAMEIEPQNGNFRYGLITLYMQQQQFEKALEQAEKLNQIFPNNPQVSQLMQIINQRLN